MKKSLLFLFIIPCIVLGQKKDAGTAGKPAAKVTETSIPAGSYRITGNIKGFPDGTVVDLLNGYNGNPEASTVLKGGAFVISGKAEQPDLKVIAFNKQAPYIALYLDNSNIKIKASSDSIDKAIVTGSPATDQYIVFTKILAPYQHLFMQNAMPDPAGAAEVAKGIEAFALKNTSSFVTPLAILRHYQVSADAKKMEMLFSNLSPQVQATPISQYIMQQITDAKKNPIGEVLPDFTQTDTAGNALSLSSLKGKYVLVDFWASWCGPCRQENPNLVAAYQRYKNKNFTVLGVSLDKAKKPWVDAIMMDNLTWPHVSDLKGWQNAVAQQYQINSIPQNFLLDPNGKIIAKNLRGAALDQKLESLLK